MQRPTGPCASSIQTCAKQMWLLVACIHNFSGHSQDVHLYGWMPNHLRSCSMLYSSSAKGEHLNQFAKVGAPEYTFRHNAIGKVALNI